MQWEGFQTQRNKVMLESMKLKPKIAIVTCQKDFGNSKTMQVWIMEPNNDKK
jgi:uncharacterized pyridoxamine 5'-phosphate oxidase family protein